MNLCSSFLEYDRYQSLVIFSYDNGDGEGRARQYNGGFDDDWDE